MNWTESNLGQVADINPRSRDWTTLPPETPVSFVPMSAISQKTASITEMDVRPLAEVRKGFTPFRDNDVLFAKITPCMENGKAALATNLQNGIGFGSTEFHVLRARGGNLPKFIYYFVRQSEFRKAARQRFRGAAGQQRVPEDFLTSYPFPEVAPTEQRRIVRILEQADVLRQKRTEADTLADRILPALFNHCFGEPTANSKGWPVSRLHELADFVSGATPSKENAAFWNGEIPWVSPKDMKREELYDSIDHVSEAALLESNLKRLPSDTTLIVVRGMILAHTVPVCLARVSVTINQDMKGLRPKAGATSEFLQWALLAQHSGLLRLVSTAAHGTRKLDIDSLRNLQIPVPPPPQRDLIKKWTVIVREQQALASKRAKCRESIEQIWRTLLQRAFTGALTAQWREAHMKELFAEMEQQARLLHSSPNGRN